MLLFSLLQIGCTVSIIPTTEEVIEQGAVIEVKDDVPEPIIEKELVEEVPPKIEEERVINPEPEEIQPIIEKPTPPKIINGRTLEQRIQAAYDNLHDAGSSGLILDDFPDVELVFEDDGNSSTFFPAEILPFHYYYSVEADKTFNLCGVGRSVFICDGKLERTITKEDIDSGMCTVTPIYMEDPRVGGSGKEYTFN